MKVIVDTSAFLALEIQNDKNYREAVKHFKVLKNKRSLFYTNEYILVEAYTRLIYDTYLQAAVKFHQAILTLIQTNQLTLLEVDGIDREDAWKELQKYSDHKLSFVDGTIAASFKKYRLDEIFTFDHHFQEINLPTNLA